MKQLEKELEDVAAHDNKKTRLKLVTEFLYLCIEMCILWNSVKLILLRNYPKHIFREKMANRFDCLKGTFN